jgi:hypothetical protein
MQLSGEHWGQGKDQKAASSSEPGMGGEGMKESSRGGEFKYDIFDTL